MYSDGEVISGLNVHPRVKVHPIDGDIPGKPDVGT